MNNKTKDSKGQGARDTLLIVYFETKIKLWSKSHETYKILLKNI